MPPRIMVLIESPKAFRIKNVAMQEMGIESRTAIVSSVEYMERARTKLAADLPSVQTYFQSGGLVDSIVNQGLPAPFDIQVSINNMEGGYAVAEQLAQKLRALHGVSDVLIPQDIDYRGLALNIDRQQASLEGLTPKTIVDSVITTMTSNGQVAPATESIRTRATAIC